MKVVTLLVLTMGGLIIGGIYLGSVTFEYKQQKEISSDLNIFSSNTGDITIGVSGDLFWGPKKSYQARLDLISTSKGHLDIWMYDITFRNLKNILAQIATQIPTRLILEQKKYMSNDSIQVKETVDVLSKSGAQVHDDSLLKVNFTHAKTLVSDDFALIQTSNLTKNSFDNNREYYFVTRDRSIINNLQALFERDRKGQKTQKSDIHDSLLICPIDCRSKIHNLISSAHNNIVIENQQLDDSKLITLLNRKIQEGIKVQIIVADKEGAESLTPQFPLGTVRKLKKPYPHAKMMLIDNKILKISSINFTTNSMDNNREIGILTNSKKAIEDFNNNFQIDRKASRR